MDTKEAIQSEFLKEYGKKEFSRITVKGICVQTPVARTTFYSYFQNTDEVLESIEDKLIAGLRKVASNVSQGNLTMMDFDLFLDETMNYVKSHWNAFETLLIIQPDRRFENKLKTAIKMHFAMRYPGKENVPNYQLITEIMASAVLGGYCYWLKNPDDMKKKRFKEVIIETLDQFVKILK